MTPTEATDLFTKAKAAAKAASQGYIDATKARYPDGNPDHYDACGFAWVEVHPGNHPFVNWCRKQSKSGPTQYYGSKGWAGGWLLWNPGEYPGQSISGAEAGARAFAQVLKDAGVTAYANSRMD